jgi:HEAT repeat protein
LAESEIVQRAKDLPARWVLLILDACYAGTTFRHDIPAGARDDQVLKALVAGTEDQPVLDGGAGDHSIFTRAVLDGLDGWADSGQRPDDIISADELIVYVKHEVPWRSRLRAHQQTPVGGPLQGSRTARDFEFRPTTPRLSAPLLRNIYSPNAEDRVAAARQLGERAPHDAEEVVRKKATELRQLLEGDDVIEVRVTAVEALGRLGHAECFEPLSKLLSHDSTEPSALRAAAASAMGDLAQRVAFLPAAVQALVDALTADDESVLEAVKRALGRVPPSGPQLQAALEDADRRHRRQLLDALACLAHHHPDTEEAWPPRDALGPWLLHRLYLARRRLRPQWRHIRRQSLALGLGGAVGLGLAYVMVVLGVRPFNPYGPAMLSYNLLPGALGGVSLALLPRLTSALARRLSGTTRALGGIVAGLILGLGLYLPNQFLNIGGSPLAYLIPGLVSGPLLGLAFTWPPWGLMAGHRQAAASTPGSVKALPSRLLAFVTVVVAGAVALALVRVPEPLAWGYLDPHGAEVLRWGVGGALFAAALAAGWGIWEGRDRRSRGG